MGVEYEYDTSLDELIADLEKIRKECGGKTRVILSSPGHYDPHFEGRNSKLTAEFKEQHRQFPNRVVIVEKDIK